MAITKTMIRLTLALGLTAALCAPSLAKGNAYAGTYAADLRSASGCGRRVLLELFTDESFVFVQRYLCRPWSDAQLTAGSWKTSGGRIVLSSGGEKMEFAIGEEGLDYVGARFGQDGLHVKPLR